MAPRPLTAAGVDRIKPPKQGQIDRFDRGYPGLCLRISYGGAKTWIFFYRLRGKLRRLSLGRFPGMTLDEARNAWRAARLAVSKGESPAHIKPTAADTFAATAEEWLQRDQAKNRSANEVRRAIEHDVMPAWGERLIAMITRRDVLELIDGVADRGALTMARRLHSHLHRLFRWAVGRGILEVNPMADLPKPGAAVKRDRVLSDGELRAVWMAAEKTAWPYGPAIRLLVLTAARREEVGALRWSEIHGNEIRIPGERSKSGEPRIIPLSPAAVDLIGALPRTGDHVFSANGSGLGGWSKAKRAIDTTAAEMNGGPLAPWRLHDIRRTTATGLQRLGVGLQVVESVLGHVSGSRAGIVGVYQRHQFEAEKRQALEAWAHEVARISGGRVHSASATFSGSGSLAAAANLTALAGATLSGSGSLTTDVRPIDMQWVAVVKRADETRNLDPLLAYLRRQPPPQLGPAECFHLELLLDRMQYKRKKRGRLPPLGEKPWSEKYQIGGAYVRRLKQSNRGLSHAERIAQAVRVHPEWFGDDMGQKLSDSMKRGQKPKKTKPRAAEPIPSAPAWRSRQHRRR